MWCPSRSARRRAGRRCRLAVLTGCALLVFVPQGLGAEGGWGAPRAEQQAMRPSYPGPFLAQVERVVDGDTVHVRAHVWPDHVIRAAVRLEGIDTPELRGRCAAETEMATRARVHTERFVRRAGHVLWLKDVRLGTYAGRVLGQLVDDQGRDLGQSLLRAGLAVPYAQRRDQRARLCGGS